MRMLHTMLRVGNLERSIQFYTEVLGMTELRRSEYPDGKFTLVFIGYGDETSNTVLELTYNWDTDRYDLGNGYGHIAIGVADAAAACDKIRNLGGNIVGKGYDISSNTGIIFNPIYKPNRVII
ncbi:MAG: lactoylglutathione lyase [Methylophagaceae bacterium]|jgi:lactoylglutathione lyase